MANTFTALTATMTSARRGHTATLLPTGQVLITGGVDNTLRTAALDTAEIYDPTAQTFTALTSTMVTALVYHTATLLPSGQVLLAGGEEGNGYGTALNTAELYNPTANTFTALSATMTTARFSHTATLLPTGEVLLAGGSLNGTGGSGGQGTVLNSAELYDPTASTFTALAATATSGHSARRCNLSSRRHGPGRDNGGRSGACGRGLAPQRPSPHHRWVWELRHRSQLRRSV